MENSHHSKADVSFSFLAVDICSKSSRLMEHLKVIGGGSMSMSEPRSWQALQPEVV